MPLMEMSLLWLSDNARAPAPALNYTRSLDKETAER